MSNAFQNAKNATTGLTIEELKDLRKYIAGLIALGPGKADAAGTILTASNHDDWVLMGITDYMRSKQLDPSGVAQLTAGKHYQTYKKKLPAFHVWIARAGTKTQQRALLRVGAELLHENLEAMGFPVSSRTMIANIHRLPSVINQQFPGYAQAGLFTMIIRKESDVRKKSSRKPVQHGRKGTDAG